MDFTEDLVLWEIEIEVFILNRANNYNNRKFAGSSGNNFKSYSGGNNLGNRNEGNGGSFSGHNNYFSGSNFSGGNNKNANKGTWNGNTYFKSGIFLECQICSRREHTAPNCYYRSESGNSQSNGITICQNCGKRGYIITLKCYHRNNYAYQGNPPPPSLVAMIAQTHIGQNEGIQVANGHGFDANDQWIIDTAATHHMTTNINNLNQAIPYLGDEQIIVGVEAPRNSLDSSEGTSLSSITKEEDNLNSTILKFQKGMQIKTTKARTSSVDFSSDISSPGMTKTPSLVARLMGLDLLPDQTNSPSSTSSSSTTTHKKISKGTRSLPETPRISSARRSDVDLHHRLSLQINKENAGVSEDLDFSKSSYKRRDLKLINFGDHENVKSPSHYARQIVKQVREGVSRRVGLDITNTSRPSVVNTDNNKQGRDELLLQLKSKNIANANASAASKSAFAKEGSSTPASCSPRIRFLESNGPKDQIQALPPKPKSPLSSLPLKPKPLQPLKEEQRQQKQKSHTASVQKRRPKLADDIGYGPRMKNKQKEEAFVSPSTATRAIKNNHIIPGDKKCKKTQLLLSSNVPTLLPVKKNPSPPATKIPPKQVCTSDTILDIPPFFFLYQIDSPNYSNAGARLSYIDQAQQVISDAQQSKRRLSQLSSSTSQTYYKHQQVSRPHHVLATRDCINFTGDIPNGNTGTTIRSATGAGGAEAELHLYVTRIIARTGIDKDTLVSFTNWFSPSNPLDPSIFHHLEHSFSTTSITTTSGKNEFSSQLGHRWNRKLLFHLVDEILVEFLRPYINLKPWVTSSNNIQFEHCNGMRINGMHLINILCYKIQSFPSVDCQVLDDIDALIDKDLPESKVQSEMAFEEEGEGIVREVEKDILDTLLHETAMSLLL
ncbi:protein LONGIFOLIA 1-like [Pyrus communis]|uniref:protein LONGIFOLIA 1-like n=1 Tax=Pyrus communis TaxID=23211 RepID=UPI0035C24E8E